jgi:sucrose-6-phosphate hydrolase SacC (GH32 family)
MRFHPVTTTALALTLALIGCGSSPCSDVTDAPLTKIQPYQPWLDDRGQHIQAHGGAIIKHGDTWYWVGEDRSKTNDPNFRYVALYASKDLMNWTFRRQIFTMSDPDNLGARWVMERPKLYVSPTTGKFVLYFHLDGQAPGKKSIYSTAKVGIATCDTIDGTYQYVRAFRPLDQESRDIGQFIDDDGSAYLIFESRPTKGFFIAKLTDDRLAIDKQVAFIEAPLEGGAIVHYDGRYYMIGSALSGWWPNANKYATAERLEGPWSEFKDVALPISHTFMSQSSNLIKITGSKSTTVVYVGDVWRPYEQWDSRYLWYPLEMKNGGMTLTIPKPWWSIDVATGETVISPQPAP